jgi:hypothetical protein
LALLSQMRSALYVHTYISRVTVLEYQTRELEKYLSDDICKFKVSRGDISDTSIGLLVSKGVLNKSLYSMFIFAVS